MVKWKGRLTNARTRRQKSFKSLGGYCFRYFSRYGLLSFAGLLMYFILTKLKKPLFLDNGAACWLNEWRISHKYKTIQALNKAWEHYQLRNINKNFLFMYKKGKDF
jgi:hypothetical protein